MTAAGKPGGGVRLPLAAGVLGMAAALLLLQVAAAETPVDATQVTVESFAFTPHDLTVTAGTTVTWTNRDEAPHTVDFDDKTVRSGALNTDDHFSYRFATPGTYAYHCSLHPQMTGSVIVR